MLKASGQEPEQTIKHTSCFEETLSLKWATPEAFTADLAARIAERFVLRRDHIDLVLREARYSELIRQPESEPENERQLPDDLSGADPREPRSGDMKEGFAGIPEKDQPAEDGRPGG